MWREIGLVDEGNLLEWEIIIIGYVLAAPHPSHSLLILSL